jgi:hypothetical protein
MIDHQSLVPPNGTQLQAQVALQATEDRRYSASDAFGLGIFHIGEFGDWGR